MRSMTGYGRNEAIVGGKKILCEIKSVNHRYLDVNMKMPKKLNFFDASIRNLLKTYIHFPSLIGYHFCIILSR